MQQKDETASPHLPLPCGMCLYTCSMAHMWLGRVWSLDRSSKTHCTFHALWFIFTNRLFLLWLSHCLSLQGPPKLLFCFSPSILSVVTWTYTSTVPSPPHWFCLRLLQLYSRCRCRLGYQSFEKERVLPSGLHGEPWASLCKTSCLTHLFCLRLSIHYQVPPLVPFLVPPFVPQSTVSPGVCFWLCHQMQVTSPGVISQVF